MCEYELLQQKNIAEREALLQDVLEAKKAVSVKPKQKKRKKKQPEFTSKYSLRTDPKKNSKYSTD